MRLSVLLGSVGHFLRSRPVGTVKSGLFGNILLTSPKGFGLLHELVERRAVKLVREIVRCSRSDALANERLIGADGRLKTTVSMVDDLSNEICCAADLSDCIRNMHCDPDYSKAAEDAMRKFSLLVETLNTTPELYEALRNSLKIEASELDEVSLRTARLLIEDFEHSGVHMQANDRAKFVELTNSIFESSAHFMEGIDRPATIGADEARQFGFSFNELYGPWCSSADGRVRKFTFTKYFQHNNVQEEHLRRLVDCRAQLAKLTGFETFSHRAQNHAILLNYENVHNFIDGIIKTATPRMEAEIEQMRQIVAANSRNYDGTPVGEWDVDFATLIHRQRMLDQLGENVKNVLYLDSLITGFETLVGRLYGLSFKIMLPEEGELWSGNVIKLNVYRDSTDFLGTIYLDVDNRPSKVQGDCHFTVRCSKLLDNGDYQTPIVVISLAIVSPELQNQNAGNSLAMLENVRLSVQQTENFFHEMGHAIHSMLGRTRFQHVAGTRCPTDFAEVPSHLMECFFHDPKVLTDILRDKSGRRLSLDEAAVLISSTNIFKTVHLLQQSLYALFDLSVHGPYADEVARRKLTTTELFNQLSDVALPGLVKAPNYAYQHRISHLVTYSGKYYSYLVARATASLIYKDLFNNDPFSRPNGLKWAAIQSHGGEYPSHYLLERVLNRAPGVEELTNILVSDLSE